MPTTEAMPMHLPKDMRTAVSFLKDDTVGDASTTKRNRTSSAVRET